jgi:hypothetical protein
MLGAIAGNTPWNYLTSLGNESSQHSIVFIVDISGFAFAKTADFSPPPFH